MHAVMPPPFTPVESVTDVLHGVPIADPYRWLEDQNSPRTRAWITDQTHYARSYLDAIPGRERIRRRIREFLDVETYDSLQKSGDRYFFRKRLPGQEQPCIYMRNGADAGDQLLIDPAARGTGPFTAVKPLRVSPNGRLLLYEVKEGGERTGTFELLDIEARKRLPDRLHRGYLRGFAFAPDSESFYYVHEAVGAKPPRCRAAYQHVLGTTHSEDVGIFFAGEDENIRLGLCGNRIRLVFFVYRFLAKTLTDIYLKSFEGQDTPDPIFLNIDYFFGLRLLDDRIFAITDREAPNRRIVEIHFGKNGLDDWSDIVPETDAPITNWDIVDNRIFVSYIGEMTNQIRIFDLSGNLFGELPIRSDKTVRMVTGSPDSDELLVEAESFTEPIRIFRYSAKTNTTTPWSKRCIPFDPEDYGHTQVWFESKDGTRIPMYLVGCHDVLDSDNNPTIMTSYGGYGVSMTPQFSVFVAFLMQRGCLFALPNIRGGSEFGVAWHEAAKRHNRQTAYDDFLSAAEWLIKTGRTSPGKLAIFGGSNSGLLVGAALTQRPDLFRAAVCMVPILDMLRYHLFDGAHVWKEEFGTADDLEDFEVLARYSPYQNVRSVTAYPAVMLVSGDADQTCNPFHARKMTARLQAANVSSHPIVLDYSEFRGHSPVLPLSHRIEALTDRLAFLCGELGIPAGIAR
jgi:prolyl oligopeptidase